MLSLVFASIKKHVMKKKDFSPVHLRTKKIAQGRESIFLDILINGLRRREHLGLYLVPENTRADKIANRATIENRRGNQGEAPG